MGNYEKPPYDITKNYSQCLFQIHKPLFSFELNDWQGILREQFSTTLDTLYTEGIIDGIEGRENPGDNINKILITAGVLKAHRLIRNIQQFVLTGFTTPPKARVDVVYVDLWFREVDSIEDPDIISSFYGLESAIREKFEAVFRIFEGEEDIVTNGNAATDLSGWTKVSGDEASSLSFNNIAPINGVGDAKLVVTSIGTDVTKPEVRLTTASPSIAGKKYKIWFKTKVNTGTAILKNIYVKGGAQLVASPNLTLSGSENHSYEFYSTGSIGGADDIRLQFDGTNLFDIEIDDVCLFQSFPSIPTPPPGHVYLRICKITRPAGQPNIYQSNIEDIRDMAGAGSGLSPIEGGNIYLRDLADVSDDEADAFNYMVNPTAINHILCVQDLLDALAALRLRDLADVSDDQADAFDNMTNPTAINHIACMEDVRKATVSAGSVRYLSPEYPNSTFYFDGTNNKVQVSTNLVYGLSASEGYQHAYYKIDSLELTQQNMDIILRVYIPETFTLFTGFKIWVKTDDPSNAFIDFWGVDSIGNLMSMDQSNVHTAGLWQQLLVNFSGSPTISADSWITIAIHCKVLNAQRCYIGELQLILE